MSYRLINANTIAESYSEVHDMPCIYADLPCGLDDGYYDMRESGELQRENSKLRELATLLLYGATHDAEPVEGLIWSQKVNVLARELGLELD